MKVFIVGLGLIGASYALKLSHDGFEVYGYDHDERVMNQAKEDGIIESNSSLDHLSHVDLIIIALYPNATIEFLKAMHHKFKENQTITDVCGVKTSLIKNIETFYPSNLSYLTHHPMAGKEKVGYDYKEGSLFKNANLIICETRHTKDKDHERLKHLSEALEFGNVTYLSKEAHDEFIAYTSQLTHVMASALINASPSDKTIHATGDSFKDLTRIANINETLWSELFLDNQDALVKMIEGFESNLKAIKDAIINHDQPTLKQLLLKGKKGRAKYE